MVIFSMQREVLGANKHHTITLRSLGAAVMRSSGVQRCSSRMSPKCMYS